MKCRLCNNEATLKDSHIIPDLAYRAILDKQSHPRMVVVRNVTIGKVVDKTQQTGFKEHLLCGACEQQFSRYESYAAKELFNKSLPTPSQLDPLGRLLMLENLEYKPLKLFLISLLWRAGVASHNFFKCVKLGPHETILHRMLLDENPGAATDYGCTVCSLLPEHEIDFREVMFQPLQTRTDGHNGYLFVLRGLAFSFYISNHQLSASIKQSFLSIEGNLPILRMRIGNYQPLCKLWNRSVGAIHSAPG